MGLSQKYLDIVTKASYALVLSSSLANALAKLAMPERRLPPPWLVEESAIKKLSRHKPFPGEHKSGGKMDVQALIIWLVVGAIAGWLAGMVVKGGGYGLIGDIVVGILGGLFAGWLLPQVGIVIGSGMIAAIIDAFIGAVILLIALRLIKRAA